MKVMSINIAEAKPIVIGNKTETTGIYKLPVASAYVGVLGLQADAIISTKHHGGPDQAVYCYTQPDHDLWAADGIRTSPGIFGENLTLSDLSSAQMVIGDRLKFGQVVLEVTSPRIPCATLASRMGDGHFIQKFRDKAAPGYYCRVITEGTICQGEAYEYIPFEGERVTVLELFNNYYDQQPTLENIRRYLRSPLAIRARKENEKRLAKFG